MQSLANGGISQPISVEEDGSLLLGADRYTRACFLGGVGDVIGEGHIGSAEVLKCTACLFSDSLSELLAERT